jgi:AcrR family transcriptional regulator
LSWKVTLKVSQSKKSVKSKKQTKRKRLSREEREKQIISEAVRYFSEVGFGGQTRELARRLGISQSLLFRYFPTKDDIIKRVYEEVYLSRWKPEWETLLSDRSRPLSDRLNQFYHEYTAAIFEFEWVRILVFSGIKGVTLYQQYIELVHDKILDRICTELRATHNLPDPGKVPLTERETDLAWNFHGGIFYIAIRKFIYGSETREDFTAAIEDSISVFLAGVPSVFKSILKK